ncbi:hypothetical protein C8R47DRAFT_1221424 [Mycena vitilis]|nr:hypothetical protein C8R47DRAFT_1221424 [Mycena vitilis]
MSIPFVDSYRRFGSRALALAKYGVDYLPTRDHSPERFAGSVSTFKDLALEGHETLPGAETRGRLQVFQCLAFGEIVSVESMGSLTGLAIELCCPKDASCAVVELWRDQIHALRRLIEADYSGMESECTNTFFASPTSGSTGCREGDRFWIYVKATGDAHRYLVEEICDVGKTIDFVVTFRRVDTTDTSSGAVETVYRLDSSGSVTVVEDQVPRRGGGAA